MFRRPKISSRETYVNPNPNAPEFEIDNWFLSKVIIERVIPHVGWHPFPLNELLLMSGAVARFKPVAIFEWGTHIGKSARIFYEVSESLGLKPIIHSIDLPDDIEHGEHPHEQKGVLVRDLKRVKLHEGDGIDTAVKIIGQMGNPTGKDVLFFVDGDHAHKSVKRELSLIIKNLPEATVLLHDTFYQSKNSGYNTGPHKAINECLKASSIKYRRVDTRTGLPGMTLLYR